MKSFRLLLIVVFVASLLQTGCSAQTTASNSSKTENQNQTVPTEQAAQKSGNHFILAGMTSEESEGLQKTLEKVEIESGPILKAGRLEQQKRWQESIEAYKEALKYKRLEWEAKQGLARSYEAIGDYQSAVFYLEQSPPKDFARPEWEQKLSALKSKAAQQNQQPT